MKGPGKICSLNLHCVPEVAQPDNTPPCHSWVILMCFSCSIYIPHCTIQLVINHLSSKPMKHGQHIIWYMQSNRPECIVSTHLPIARRSRPPSGAICRGVDLVAISGLARASPSNTFLELQPPCRSTSLQKSGRMSCDSCHRKIEQSSTLSTDICFIWSCLSGIRL